MEAAWNRGDFKGYMDGFANPDVIFISRGEWHQHSDPAQARRTVVITLNHVSARVVSRPNGAR